MPTLQSYIDTLRKKGLIPNIIPESVATAIIKSKSIDAKDNEDRSALSCAFEHHNSDLLKDLIENQKAKCNELSEEGIPYYFMTAATPEGLPLLQYLLKNKMIDVNTKGEGDVTLLLFALSLFNSEALNEILKHNPNFEVLNQLDFDGYEKIILNQDPVFLETLLKCSNAKKVLKEVNSTNESLYDIAEYSPNKNALNAMARISPPIHPPFRNHFSTNQGVLNSKLIEFIELNSKISKSKVAPYKVSDILDERGNCFGWSSLYTIYFSRGAIDEFREIKRLLNWWNGELESTDRGPGLNSPLKYFSNDSFVEKYQKNLTHESTIADVIGQLCNDLSIFQKAALKPTASHFKNVYSSIGSRQYCELYRHSGVKVSVNELTQIIETSQHYPDSSMEIGFIGVPGHSVTYYIDRNSRYHYLDSNLNEEYSTKDPALLANYIFNETAKPLRFVNDNNIYINFDLHRYYPSGQKIPEIVPTTPFLKTKNNPLKLTDFHLATMNHNADEFIRLMKINPSDMTKKDFFGDTPIDTAIKHQATNVILQYLGSIPGNKKPYMQGGEIDFHSLSFYEMDYFASLILQGDIHPDIKDRNGDSLLKNYENPHSFKYVFENDNLLAYSEMINKFFVSFPLLEGEADLFSILVSKIETGKFKQPLHDVFRKSKSLLDYLVEKKEYLALKTLLKNAKAKIETADLQSALVGAVQLSDSKAIRILMTAGAKPDVKNKDGESPEDFARGKGLDVIEALHSVEEKPQASKKESVKPNPVVIKREDKSVKPKPVVVKNADEPIKPEPVVVKKADEPVKPKPVVVKREDKSVKPKPDVVQKADEPVKPKPVAAKMAKVEDKDVAELKGIMNAAISNPALKAKIKAVAAAKDKPVQKFNEMEKGQEKPLKPIPKLKK